jgi:hypothetical protein
MFADCYHADLFSAGDENSTAGACFCRPIAVEKLGDACEASGTHTKAIKLRCEGNILNQTATPTSSILRKQREILR